MPGALTPTSPWTTWARLSTDIRAAVVLDADGRPLAGAEALAAPARALLEIAPGAAAIEVLTERGGAFAVRGARHALCVATGRFALPALVLYDLRAVLEDLEREAA